MHSFDDAISAFKHSLEEDRNARYKISEENDPKSLLDKFNKLDEDLKTVLLIDSSSGSTIPKIPTDRLANIVAAKSGAMVALLLNSGTMNLT